MLRRRTRSNAWSQRRRSLVETLESRRLLASVDILPEPWWNDSFVVRRDESEAVELTLYGWHPDSEVFGSIEEISPIAEHGIVELAADKRGNATDSALTLLYQPEPGFTGIDRIALRSGTSTDVSPEIDSLRFELAVHVVEPLFGVQDWFQVGTNSDSNKLDVLSNDIQSASLVGVTGVSGLDLRLTSVEFADDHVGGTVEISSDGGHLVFAPADDFEGLRTISYLGVDPNGYEVLGTAFARVSDVTNNNTWPEELETEVIQLAVDQHRYRFGGAANTNPYLRFADDIPSTPMIESADASGTNNQIAGVEESDRVKTDGNFLYVLSTPEPEHWIGWDLFPRISVDDRSEGAGEQGNLLTIIDVRQADHPTIVSRQIFDDPVQSLDLNGDRLTVITQSTNQTVINAIDVTDPVSPKQLLSTTINGNYVESRRVGGVLYVFTEEYGFAVPPLNTIQSTDGDFTFNETPQQFFSHHSVDQLIESIFPSYQTRRPAPELEAPVTLPFAPATIAEDYLGTYSRSHLVSIDTTDPGGSVLDWQWSKRSEHRLVTSESIYITYTDYQPLELSDDQWNEFSFAPESSSINTSITRYEISQNGLMIEAGHGVVPGTLNNQFSLDEYQGTLRLATENPWWTPFDDPSEPAGANLYVLQVAEGDLELIGGVEGLAPGEQVYAVRFAADRGYVVTFRQVDPLFVIDLSQPSSPEVLGQLKTPGYSQYLHVIDENHLLGIGRDADEVTGQFGALTVSLFDVSDPHQPSLQDRYEFEGGRSTFSPFAGGSPRDLRDHHAINFFSQQQILAIPIYSESFGFFDPDDQPIFVDGGLSAMRTLSIDPQIGITELDSIEFDDRVDRGIRIESLLYSISNRQLKVSQLGEASSHFATLDFETEGQDDHIDFPSGEEIFADLTANDRINGESLELLKAELVSGEAEIEITGDHRLRLRHSGQRLQPIRVRYVAESPEGTLFEAIATIDPDLVWQNSQLQHDVNQDGLVSARDVLNVINLLDQYGAVDCEVIEESLDLSSEDKLRFLFDISGDRKLSAIDALRIINRLADSPLSEPEYLSMDLSNESERSARDADADFENTLDSIALKQVSQEVGIDLGLDHLFSSSDSHLVWSDSDQESLDADGLADLTTDALKPYEIDVVQSQSVGFSSSK